MPQRIPDDERQRAAMPAPPAQRVRAAGSHLRRCGSSTMHIGIAFVFVDQLVLIRSTWSNRIRPLESYFEFATNPLGDQHCVFEYLGRIIRGALKLKVIEL